jgi:type IV pilus assembly protein PilB
MNKNCYDRRLIGEILVERGLIMPVQLRQALAVQKGDASHPYLGEVLTNLGYASEIDIVIALVVQCNLPYIAVAKHMIDKDVARLIPSDVARRNRLVPLDKIGNILSVVMQNPLDESMRHEVEALTGCCIATFISTRSEIDQVLERIYPVSKERS